MLQIKRIIITICLFFLSITNVNAILISGVEFPDGEISFADSVIEFAPGGVVSGLLDRTQIASNALGTPNYNNLSTCNVNNSLPCQYVTLGDGGFIVLRFDNNVLTGSDNSELDLWIFEVGSDVENTFVDVSFDGLNWVEVGEVAGATSGIDIDSYGFDSSAEIRYVRLRDNPDEGQQSGDGPFVGADIDAVGAISTRFVPPVEVSEPNGLALLLGMCILISYRKKHRRARHL